jgi:hypothetical protein
MLSLSVVAAPHPCSIIVSGYLMYKATDSEGALAEIDVRTIANHMSMYSTHEQELTAPG